MLSIVIPAYNHAAYIEEAISKARAIPVPGKRIFVIDDASPDNTEEVVTAYLAREGAEEVEYIRKPVNKGAVDSLNMFIDACETEYVYMIASDDLAVPEGVRALVDELTASPELGFVIGGGKNLREDGQLTPIYTRKHDHFFSNPPEELTRMFFLRDISPLLLQSTVFRLKTLRHVGGLDDDLVADDYALFAKLFMKFPHRGVDFEFRPDIDSVRYRHHSSNSYRNLSRQANTYIEVIYRFAPRSVRHRAAGYKLARLMLMGIKNKKIGPAFAILRSAKPRDIPWIGAGLFITIQQWLRDRL